MRILLIFIPAFFPFALNAQKAMEPVVVTASRSGLPVRQLTQNVIVIGREEIRGKFASADEVLRYAAGLDIRSRRAGIQSDVSVRGSSYEQTLILVDGVEINNSQTGHYNLNLPVDLSQVERIEIMPGGGSSLYGSYGSGGTINFITGRKVNRAGARLEYGSFNTWRAGLFSGFSRNGWFSRFSLSRAGSDGFYRDTGYRNFGLNASAGYESAALEGLVLSYGFLVRDYGAFDFYTPGKNLPSRDRIRNGLTSLALKKKIGPIRIEPRAYYNASFDHFILDGTRPDWVNNTHRIRKGGGELLSSWQVSGAWLIHAAVSGKKELIDSSNLGSRERTTLSCSGEVSFRKEEYGFQGSLRYDRTGPSRDIFSYSTGVYAWPFSFFKLRTLFAFSYRLPSFTELYYSDSISFGDPLLKPERSYTWEAGQDLFAGPVLVKNTFFYKREFDLIDWVSRAGVWRAENIDRVRILGDELEIILPVRPFRMTLRNTIQKPVTETAYLSKYRLNRAQNRLSAMLDIGFSRGIACYALVSYTADEEQKYAITSAGFDKSFFRGFTLFINVKNIFDDRHEDIPGIRAPGRELLAGMDYQVELL